MMAGWFDKIRKAVEPDDEPYDFDDEEIYPTNNDIDDNMIRPNNNAQMGNMYGGNNPTPQNNNFGGYGGGGSPMPNSGGQQPGYPMNNQQPSMGMVPTTSIATAGIQSSMEIITITPTDKDRTGIIQIAQHLMNSRVVVLNLEHTNKEMSRRYLDFLRGVAFAISGEVKLVSTDTYILSPNNNVKLSSEQDRDDRGGGMDRPF